MNELIREIEEDIRRERFDRLWKSVGKMLVGLSIFIILATVAIEVFKYYSKANNMEKTSIFLKGIERQNSEDYKGAKQFFSEFDMKKDNAIYGLAMLRKAQSEAALLQPEEAIKTYQALGANDKVFGKLAPLFTPTIEKPEQTLVLSTSEAPGKTPFYYSRSELRAWQLLQQGKKDDAIAEFLKLYNESGIPQSMRERMRNVLNYLAADMLPIKTSEMKELLHE
jgi:hypothetical protein